MYDDHRLEPCVGLLGLRRVWQTAQENPREKSHSQLHIRRTGLDCRPDLVNLWSLTHLSNIRQRPSRTVEGPASCRATHWNPFSPRPPGQLHKSLECLTSHYMTLHSFWREKLSEIIIITFLTWSPLIVALWPYCHLPTLRPTLWPAYVALWPAYIVNYLTYIVT